MSKTKSLFERRKSRVRHKILNRKNDLPRLSVHRSNENIYAQIIDDKASKTIVSSSTLEKEMRTKVKTGANKEAASLIGKTLAEKAKKAGIEKVVFDRGGNLYHGRVKALAEAARSAGLTF